MRSKFFSLVAKGHLNLDYSPTLNSSSSILFSHSFAGLHLLIHFPKYEAASHFWVSAHEAPFLHSWPALPYLVWLATPVSLLKRKRNCPGCSLLMLLSLISKDGIHPYWLYFSPSCIFLLFHIVPFLDLFFVLFIYIYFFSFFFLFLAAPMAYGSSQARGPKLGSCNCQPTPQPQQCRIWAISVTYTAACNHAGSLTHWARPGIEPTFSWRLC